ncbi:acyl-CoA synthetase (AMP-forming)/AMP-acid ligase II [Bacillus ectoiniformans]|uniref:class I adenylate-forming enzyme family protein n=1 Tax=Bacillus ectoiniformans TaxID=1494429 RepID=UPI00195A9567|nr:class I adenylate-forming enzyme family protein [Bacillus ectoiniformans]MBM7648700.1 acyl-CoA synthetase (AMP-forming)/AMP-acid ligase II [Bacillus ectoiniformans]
MIIDGELYGRDVKMYANRPANVYDMLIQSAALYPDKEALIKNETRLTYQELVKQTDTAAAHLMKNYHIHKGDRIALLTGNRIEFVIAALACAKIGAMFVPLNTKLTADNLTYMLSHSGAKLLITEKELVSPLLKWVQNSESLEGCLLIDGLDPTQGLYSFHDELLKEPAPPVSFPIVEETESLYIMYTSGTTGTPKGAVGSHTNVIHSSISYQIRMNTTEHSKTLLAVPLFHVTGLIGQLFHMILTGGTIVLMERYQTEPFIQSLVSEKITFLFNVPTIYVMLMSSSSFQSNSYEYVETIAYGGAPMSAETIKQIHRFFPNASMHNAYGATETSSPATIMPERYPPEKISSVGLPVPVGEVKTVNSDGSQCGPGEIGELYIKGPMIVKEYWNNEEANRSAFSDGYWKSGDIALLDQDGFVYIMDRKKDMINRGGEKIYSIEVENALYAHPKVLEASVVGIPDSLFGEEVKAYIVQKPGETITADDILSFTREKLAGYKIPKHIEFIQELPRNPGGKVLKTKLAQSTIASKGGNHS